MGDTCPDIYNQYFLDGGDDCFYDAASFFVSLLFTGKFILYRGL